MQRDLKKNVFEGSNLAHFFNPRQNGKKTARP